MPDGTDETRASPLVVFAIEGTRLALPLPAVERVLPMVAAPPLPRAPAIALGAINLHGRVLPVLDLRRRLGFPPRAPGLSTRLLVAAAGRRSLALPVDDVLGIEHVAADSVADPAAVLPGLRHVSGIVPLADGLLYIHDLESFLSLEEEARLAAALEDEPR